MGPVLNWYASQVAAEKTSPITAWPMQAMNLAPDQVILTHLLTAGRSDQDRWLRTCVIVRPFHALSNFALTYSREAQPSGEIIRKQEDAIARPDSLPRDRQHFWLELFRGRNDPYVKMLERVSYASFFLGAVPRLDSGNLLPRIEFVVNSTNLEDHPLDWESVSKNRAQLVSALRENKFDVAAEHSMFEERTRLDVLPSLLIQTHDTVKHWATDLLARVQEYIGYYLARYVKGKELRGVRVRPFTTSELKLLYAALKSERDQQAGAAPDSDEHAVVALLDGSGDEHD